MAAAKPSGNTTARRAAEILVGKGLGFAVPTAKQKKNLVVAFAKRDMIVYGKAFDVVRLSGQVDLNDLGEVERRLKQLTLYEIKSTVKKYGDDFRGHFFSLTAAEILVSQSLREQFKFVFVNVHTGSHLELTLSEMFARAKGIYPGWSISF
jgi:hypothetical protein